MYATERQIEYMESHGIEVPAGCTKAEATELITAYQAHNDPADERHPHDLES